MSGPAQDASVANMQPTARSLLVERVQEHLVGLIRSSVSVQRHAKRARLYSPKPGDSVLRRRVHASDINLALKLQGKDKLYASRLVSSDATSLVKVKDFIRHSAESLEESPAEVSCRLTWICNDGDQKGQVHEGDGQASNVLGVDPLRVHHLRASILSEELQLYFSRLRENLQDEYQVEKALITVATDSGLQEIVPFLVQYTQAELLSSLSNDDCTRADVFVRLITSLLHNHTLHLSLHLHEWLPVLVTCIVADKLPRGHARLRELSSFALHTMVQAYTTEYHYLSVQVLNALSKVVDSSSPNKRYGATFAISLFGHAAVETFLLETVLSTWDDWGCESAYSHDCRQAYIQALGLYLRGSPTKHLCLNRGLLLQEIGDCLVSLDSGGDMYDHLFL